MLSAAFPLSINPFPSSKLLNPALGIFYFYPGTSSLISALLTCIFSKSLQKTKIIY
jgi:hypothetical protein